MNEKILRAIEFVRYMSAADRYFGFEDIRNVAANMFADNIDEYNLIWDIFEAFNV